MLKNSKLKKRVRIMCAAFILASFTVVFSGCAKKTEKKSDFFVENMSFRSIPGITDEEISAIEALRYKYSYFEYGINRTTEAFEGKDGRIYGFAVMFCRWLSEMFAIQFTPRYHEWGDLLRGLETGDIDFTGERMFIPEGREGYFMSNPTINRSIRSYRIQNSIPITEILRTRLPRFAFLRGAVVSDDVEANVPYSIVTVIVDSHSEAYNMLKNGEIDAFFGMDTAEGAFDAYGDVVGEEFYPMIFRSSCLTTHKEELQPIISVLDKMLSNNRTMEYLTSMQKRGHQQYMENRINSLLTEEERKYIQEHPVIPIAADFSNYPISFYNTYSDKWEGVYFEALDEVSKFTGLKFEPANDTDTPLLKAIDNVEKGKALILPELYQIKEYEGRFLWSDVPILNDNFAFISKSDMRNIDINDVFHLRVAIRKASIFSEMFKKIFPAHKTFIEYDTMEQSWDALNNGEVDLIFASRRRLAIYTNYYEQADFKLNLVFNHTFESFFAFNKDEALLKSIVDKSLRFININNMTNQWIYKTYDYRRKMAAAQRPWLIGAAASFFLVLLLVTIMLIRSRNSGRRLEKIVTQRTSALSYETSKLHSMIDSIPDLMFCKDKNLRYTQCNKPFEEFIGVPEGTILDKTDDEGLWLPPEQAERIRIIEQTVMNENKILTLEEKVLFPLTGKECVFETTKAPIIQDGAVVGIIAIIRDITQRKKTEKELSFKTSQLKMIIDSIPDGMFCKDIDLKYIQCNKVFENFTGVHEEQILGKSDDEEGSWLAPDAIEKIYRVERTVIDEKRSLTFEETVPLASGKEIIFETTKAPIIQDGAVVGIIAIIRDITPRKEMERNLALQTSLFKTMLSSLPDAVFCKNLNFKYTLCNNYMAEMIGRKIEDIIGKDDVTGMGLPPETAAIAKETDRKVVNEQQRIMYEEWMPCADGVMRLFETVKSPLILEGDVVGIMAIARDVTRRKEMEEEAMAANRAKSSFLANMSHELRTPLNVVIGLTDLILEDDMNAHTRENLIKISNAGSTLLSIVNDILDFSKIESGKLSLSPVEYYMSSILNDIITLVLTRIGEKPVQFILNIKDDLPNKLYGDDLRVKQILTNLLTNAVKYTREGSIELSVRCMREGGTVWMDAAIIDTGMGIPKEDIKNLFLDYYQVSANANRNIEGTGLGLPITKRLVEMMGGEISVESEHGKGSTFRFRIKQGFVNDMPLGAEISEKLRTFNYSDDKRAVGKKLVRVNLSYAKVLVVDDMQTNLDVASGILRKYQMQVDCLTNGLAAIDRIREGTPVYNAIFMDHMMPGMDGIETADKIRAIGTEYAKKVPIIALTANAISGTDKMFYAHGFQGFITKPIDVIEMDTVLRKWVYDSQHEHTSDAGAAEKDAPVPEVVVSEDEPIEINIKGVDTKKGLALYANETDIYLPMLRSYVVNTPTTLEKLRQVKGETLSDYVISVHGLKGTSAGIGAENIRVKALELEQMSRAGDLQGVLLKNDKLIADTEVIVANITAWLKDYDSRNAKPRQKAPDRKLLAKLKQCCENYDMSGIDEVMEELDKTDFEEDAELIAWIKEKIVISEIGEVAERLAQY